MLIMPVKHLSFATLLLMYASRRKMLFRLLIIGYNSDVLFHVVS